MSLNAQTKSVIEECAQRSHEGSIDFGTVIARLVEVGVESYHADYRHGQTVYYLPDGSTHAVLLTSPEVAIDENFDAVAVQAAVRGAQSGEVKYPEFKRLTMQAGCIGYFVWIAGRHVRYMGRRGESHIERFPDQTVL